MKPYLSDGDVVYFERIEPLTIPVELSGAPVRCGDIVLLSRPERSEPTVHRVTGSGEVKGDRVKHHDHRLSPGPVRITGIVRGRIISSEGAKSRWVSYDQKSTRFLRWIQGQVSSWNIHRMIVVHRLVQVALDGIGFVTRRLEEKTATWADLRAGAAEIRPPPIR